PQEGTTSGHDARLRCDDCVAHFWLPLADPRIKGGLGEHYGAVPRMDAAAWRGVITKPLVHRDDLARIEHGPGRQAGRRTARWLEADGEGGAGQRRHEVRRQ